jgi:hypothetical protein
MPHSNRRARLFLAAAMTAAALAACAHGNDASDLGPSADDDRDAAGSTAQDEGDSGATGANERKDAAAKSTKDAGVDPADGASSDATTTTGMDPDLDLPGAGTSCAVPGASCPNIMVCRIAGPNAGRCEGCTTCGNLGASCTDSAQCDILFQCFKGRCTNICPLGTSYCGPVADCIDVGHATHGVCNP